MQTNENYLCLMEQMIADKCWFYEPFKTQLMLCSCDPLRTQGMSEYSS